MLVCLIVCICLFVCFCMCVRVGVRTYLRVFVGCVYVSEVIIFFSYVELYSGHQHFG